MWLAWNLCQSLHLPGGTNGKEPSWQCRRWKRGGFHPWIREDPPGKAWQPTPVFCPGESRGRRSLAGYSPGGCKELDTTEVTWQTPTVHWRAQKQGRRLCPSNALGRQALNTGRAPRQTDKHMSLHHHKIIIFSKDNKLIFFKVSWHQAKQQQGLFIPSPCGSPFSRLPCILLFLAS